MPPQPNGGFAWVQAGGKPALVCRALEPVAAHFFTTREWRLGSVPADRPDDAWAEVAGAIGVERHGLVRGRQVHGAGVIVHRAGDAPGLIDGDIIISDAAVALAIQTADCIPLLIADRRTGAIAAVHAGWRGLAARVPQIAVDALRRELASRTADLVAAIGPSIGACCYEVGEDVREAHLRAGFGGDALSKAFHDRPQASATNRSMKGLPEPRPHHWYFDGWSLARHQLAAAGIPDNQIHVASLCTASHETLCSYRRDGASAGRMAAAIAGAGVSRPW
jgi:purine-nucleoside/S-methyl-5'-thioadenosine phosphorylase / adenosine deaminase